jgi:hypothetical protein
MSAFRSRVKVSFDKVSYLLQSINMNCYRICSVNDCFHISFACILCDQDQNFLILIRYSHSGKSNDVDQSSHMLAIATRDLFNELDKSVKPVAPMQFWMVCSLVLLFSLILHLSYLSFTILGFLLEYHDLRYGVMDFAEKAMA